VKKRWRVLTSLMMVALIAGVMPGLARAGRQAGRRASEDTVRIVRIYYQAPVLVKAGESVAMPVHVVCVTAGGRACDAELSLGVRAGTGDAWRFQTAVAKPGLTVDLSAPAARASASSADQSVAFFLQAHAGTVTTSLPASHAGPPLRFYVTSQIHLVTVPTVPIGRSRRGRTVLFAPWGSGPGRAGLALGRESLTLGPSAFDVDRAGRVHLLDALQGRLAEFKGHRLLHQWPVQPESADVAVAADGTAYVAHVRKGVVGVTRLGPSGRNLGSVSLGSGVLSQVRTAGSTAYAEILPLDAWVRIPASRGRAAQLTPISGRPLASGERVLRVGTERFVRLGIVRDGRVHAAVELRSARRFGEVALAESDGAGGYVVVARVWRSRPKPADHFQVIHISRGHVAETFAVSSRGFADARPMSRFRLGPDGSLYQLVTGSAGIRIARFELKGES